MFRDFATTPTGAGISLPVSRGDTLDMKVYGYYEGGSGYSDTTSLTLFIASVAEAFGGLNGGTTQEQGIYNVFDNAYNGGAATMLGTGNDNVPAAYLNYILFDENLVSYQFGYKPISNNANWSHEELLIDDILVTRKGFVYVYLTNESATGNVYFDDMEVTVKESAVVQEDNYYPFGLAFNSWRRATGLENRINTFQGQERVEDLGLNWYQFKWRNHDPAISRFFNVDPLAEDYYYNSPYAFSENKVTSHVEIEGLEAAAANAVWAEGKKQYDYVANKISSTIQNASDKLNGAASATYKFLTSFTDNLPKETDPGYRTGDVVNIDGDREGSSENITPEHKGAGNQTHIEKDFLDGMSAGAQSLKVSNASDIGERMTNMAKGAEKGMQAIGAGKEVFPVDTITEKKSSVFISEKKGIRVFSSEQKKVIYNNGDTLDIDE